MNEWKLVPVEPTDEMIRAIDGLICSSYLWPVYAYRAMIDAAPVQQTDPLGYFTLNALQELVDEAARLRAENERLNGALQEIAATPAKPSNHDLVAVIMLAQLALRDENGG